MPPIREELQRFAESFGVPAIGGGVVTASGEASFDVRGKCRRGGGDEASLDHQWHIGSCAKSMTAALFARLIEQGRAEWQTTIGDVFSDLAGNMDPGWHRRTIEELFYCRAGMRANPSVGSMKASWADKRSLPDQRTEVAKTAMAVPPKRVGKFIYSNLSYMVVGAAIDRLTGGSYEQALRERLLKPLGISTLGFGPPPDVWGHAAKLRLGSVTLFKGAPMDPSDVRSDNPGVFSSAGTMHLTLADWAKFLQLFITSEHDLLTKQTIDELLSGPDDYQMIKGWARADIPGVSFGVQGSNTLWAAAALLSENRDRVSLVVCNDGRTRIVTQTAMLATRLLQMRR